MEKGRPNIFDYSNYREFLQDFYLHKKKQSKAFSHRVFVRLCGFSSPNFLKLVMEGKRNLGKAALKKVLSYLKLNKTERQYFEAMVHFCQAKNGSAKNKYFSDMARLHHQAKVKNIDIKQYNYLSRWHYVALRELVALDGFKEDAMWINKKLNTRLSKNRLKRSSACLLT